VAYQWRIRHKLLLGLGLVEGLLGLLLTGTLIGLLSYHWTMKSIGSKLDELNAAERLKEAVSEIEKLNPNEPDQLTRLRKGITKCRQDLDAYEERLNDTLHRRRDPNGGFNEKQFIDELNANFDGLQTRIDHSPEGESGPGHSYEKYKEDVQGAIHGIIATATDLCNEINSELGDRIGGSQRPYRLSMWIVLTTSGVGGLLMIGLLRFFYGWIFNPIRDLEQGVNRVARGDFEHRIVLHSGDEMEELAAAFNDMTNRLDEMYRDLAHQVNERSRQLVRSERLASVGFLAAGVAHEINNPLASIAFCSEALESRLSEILAQTPEPKKGTVPLSSKGPSPFSNEQSAIIRKYLHMIQEEAFRCKAITQRLLEFSRGGERRREPTDLAELIQSVLDMVQHLQNVKGKQIIFEPPAGAERGAQSAEREERNASLPAPRSALGAPRAALLAWVNAQEIKSVVLNLVINALDSMDEGGTLTITLRQHDRMAEMVFADSGCGMSPEILENIFEPFFTRSRTGKGTGLGLSISHRVIAQHGGEIEATSSGLNQGSTFIVRLPLQPAESIKEETIGRAAA
jgi:two-component system NtrC family sensor kinase